MQSKQWFSVDKAGLGRQAEEQGRGRLVGELIQNSLDEPGVTKIDVTLAMVPGEGMADLVVEDDSPQGFRNLSDAYTMFAESYKRTNPSQRGRYNIGEKFVLAVCENACISTTTGTVIFDADLGRTEKPDARERGSVFQGRMKMTQEEYVQVCDYLRSLLLPDGISVMFNGQQLLARHPIHTFQASLETVLADAKGVMRPTTRKAEVSLYEALPGEVAHLYEMGLPIVEMMGDRWHVNVGQKVPLNKERNNAPPRYLKAVRTHVLNAMHDRLTQEDANADWVRASTSDPNCSPEAIKKVLNLRFGDKFAAFDPNDKEAGKNFVAQGGQLVYGPMLSPQEWQNAKKAGAIQSAGKICPTPKPFSQDPDAKNVTVIPKEQWTDGMNAIAGYARFLGRELMDVEVTVTFVNTTNRFLAAYGVGGNLIFNVHHLGYQWFENGVNVEVDRLLLHELSHHFSGDHLSEEYHEGICLLGAKLKTLAMDKPQELRQWR